MTHAIDILSLCIWILHLDSGWILRCFQEEIQRRDWGLNEDWRHKASWSVTVRGEGEWMCYDSNVRKERWILKHFQLRMLQRAVHVMSYEYWTFISLSDENEQNWNFDHNGVSAGVVLPQLAFDFCQLFHSSTCNTLDNNTNKSSESSPNICL